MATKSISKSVRLTEEVNALIEAAPGKGFNEKFENIILRAHKHEPELKKRLSDLNEQVEKEQRKLYELFERYRYLDEFFRLFLRMQHQLHDLGELLDKACYDSKFLAMEGEQNNEQI